MDEKCKHYRYCPIRKIEKYSCEGFGKINHTSSDLAFREIPINCHDHNQELDEEEKEMFVLYS